MKNKTIKFSREELKNKNLKLLEKEVLYKNQDITKELKAHKSPYKRIAYINRLGNKI